MLSKKTNITISSFFLLGTLATSSVYAVAPQTGECESVAFAWEIDEQGTVIATRELRELNADPSMTCIFRTSRTTYDSAGLLDWAQTEPKSRPITDKPIQTHRPGTGQFYRNDDGTWTIQTCYLNIPNAVCAQAITE
jgi:hypothetical protein